MLKNGPFTSRKYIFVCGHMINCFLRQRLHFGKLVCGQLTFILTMNTQRTRNVEKVPCADSITHIGTRSGI